MFWWPPLWCHSAQRPSLSQVSITAGGGTFLYLDVPYITFEEGRTGVQAWNYPLNSLLRRQGSQTRKKCHRLIIHYLANYLVIVTIHGWCGGGSNLKSFSKIDTFPNEHKVKKRIFKIGDQRTVCKSLILRSSVGITQSSTGYRYKSRNIMWTG